MSSAAPTSPIPQIQYRKEDHKKEKHKFKNVVSMTYAAMQCCKPIGCNVKTRTTHRQT